MVLKRKLLCALLCDSKCESKKSAVFFCPLDKRIIICEAFEITNVIILIVKIWFGQNLKRCLLVNHFGMYQNVDYLLTKLV